MVSKPPRGPTAYFIFADEQRDTVKKAVQEAAPDGKAGVAAVGKAIGELWGKLSEEEKQGFKDLAAQRGAALQEQWAQQQQEAAEAGGSQQGAEGEEAAGLAPAAAGAPPPPFGLPTSLVKKIMVMDGEVGRVSADGLRAVAKATELFLQLLAAKAYTHAKGAKRKNIKFSDLAAVAGRDRRLVDMGLGEVLERDPVFAEAHARAEEDNQGRRGNKRAADEEEEEGEERGGKGMRPITAFFAANP